MNAEKLFKLAMAVLFAAAIIGCSDRNSDNDSDGPNQVDTPKIKRAYLNVLVYVKEEDKEYWFRRYPYEAYAGQPVCVGLWFYDHDSDLKTLYINHFHESDGYTNAVRTQSFQIPGTDYAAEFNYEFEDDWFAAPATTGQWKLRLYAVDEAGNESNEYELDFLVRLYQYQQTHPAGR
jgi:ribonuclease BN (tRNA processing enzyme)